jgi:hypothetical protein
MKLELFYTKVSRVLDFISNNSSRYDNITTFVEILEFHHHQLFLRLSRVPLNFTIKMIEVFYEAKSQKSGGKVIIQLIYHLEMINSTIISFP